jgi:hypothetical protein
MFYNPKEHLGNQKIIKKMEKFQKIYQTFNFLFFNYYDLFVKFCQNILFIFIFFFLQKMVSYKKKMNV